MVATRIPGEDVKSMVRQGARKRMCFGFCHDKNNDPVLMIEPGKKPEALKTPLKKAGGEPPMIWGTFVVRSDQMEMICEKVSAKVIKQLFNHPLTESGLAAFVKDWESTGQSIL